VRRALLILWCVAACPSPVPPPPPPPTTPTDAELLANRPYKEYVPASLPDAGVALIVVLAGYGGLSETTTQYLELEPVADAYGAVIAMPNGVRDSQGQLAWHPGTAHAPYFDVEFIRAVIRDMKTKHPIDPSRVFVAGHSQGGHMAYRMACDDGDDVPEIMVLAGQSPTTHLGCAAAVPVSVLHVHGDDDDVIGYYGDVQGNPPDPTIPGAHQSVATWAAFDGCDGGIADAGIFYDFDTTLPGPETAVETYSGCARGTGVDLWTIRGGGHDPVFNGTFAIEVWDWWLAHPRQ
jgi:polyhydroxybutyrate depolymerase